jgi:O-antigen ligase
MWRISQPLLFTAWISIGMLIILTLPRWVDLISGFKGTVILFAGPALISYIILNILDGAGINKLVHGIPFVFLIIAIQLSVILINKQFFQTDTVISNVFTSHKLNIGWGRSNYIAAFLSMGIIYLLAYTMVYQLTLLKKILIYAQLIIMGLFIVIIMSRGALISLFIGIVAIIGVRLYFNKKVPWWQMGIVITSTIYLLYNYLVKFIYRIIYLHFDLSTLARMSILKDSIDQIKANPLLGQGPQQHRYMDFFQYHEDPHNIFLRYGVDLGIMGIVVIFIILLLPLFNVYRNAKSKHSIVLFTVPLYLTMVANSQFEITITSYWYGMVFWIIYSIILSLDKAQQMDGAAVYE